MSQKIKILAIFIVVLVVGYLINIKIDESVKSEKQVSFYTAKTETYLELLPRYFNQKIEVENFDNIESIFKEADEAVQKLASIDVEKYSDLVKKFENLKHKKDRYKAIKSEIAMSYLFIHKEISKDLSNNLELQKILNDALLFGVDVDRLEKLLQLEQKFDSQIEMHLNFLVKNSKLLQGEFISLVGSSESGK